MPDNRKHAAAGNAAGETGRGRWTFEQVRLAGRARPAADDGPGAAGAPQQLLLPWGLRAFDLKDYETAIRHYDAARERYPKDPASLVAMIQIVNAYIELGDTQRAQTANYRAKAFYDSLIGVERPEPAHVQGGLAAVARFDAEAERCRRGRGQEPAGEDHWDTGKAARMSDEHDINLLALAWMNCWSCRSGCSSGWGR